MLIAIIPMKINFKCSKQFQSYPRTETARLAQLREWTLEQNPRFESWLCPLSCIILRRSLKTLCLTLLFCNVAIKYLPCKDTVRLFKKV